VTDPAAMGQAQPMAPPTVVMEPAAVAPGQMAPPTVVMEPSAVGMAQQMGLASQMGLAAQMGTQPVARGLVPPMGSAPPAMVPGYPPPAPVKANIQVGAHSLQGQKLDHPNWQNQDLQAVVPLGEARCFAVVFDGHGMWGHIVAAKACEAMVQNVKQVFPEAPAPVSDHEARAGLEKLFALAQAAIEAGDVDSQGRRLADFSGTTATAALVDAATGRASVAHVGDSALAAYAHGRVLHRTTDHHVDDEAEQRCRARGGEVREFEISGINVRRLCLRGSQFPGLAMSRALGDLTARDLGLRSDPEVCAGLPFAPGTILVLASDGVWEKTKADLVGARVAGLAPQAAARELVEWARSQWNPSGNIDDITAIVVAGVN